MNTELDVNTKNGEKKPIFGAKCKWNEGFEVEFKIPNKIYIEAKKKNYYVWFQVRYLKYLNFYRCFKI
ncbi:hypothetical protein NBRC116188_21710 [Oceaniserpentilla sp. 4NH20-0058]